MSEMRERAVKWYVEHGRFLSNTGDIVDGLLTAALDPEDEALVEAAAKAMFLVGDNWNSNDTFDSAPEYARDMWRDRARAAVETLKRMAQGETNG